MREGAVRSLLRAPTPLFFPVRQRRSSPPCANATLSPPLPSHKLAHGLLSGEHSQPPASPDEGDEAEGVTPRMFKGIAGKGHPEFSTGAQQDAMEFWQHIVERLSRSARQFQHADPATLFSFERETRSECNSSQKVRYTTSSELHVSVMPDQGDAVNLGAYTEYCAKKEAAEQEAAAAGKVGGGRNGGRLMHATRPVAVVISFSAEHSVCLIGATILLDPFSHCRRPSCPRWCGRGFR